jgi:hypothetical protein
MRGSSGSASTPCSRGARMSAPTRRTSWRCCCQRRSLAVRRSVLGNGQPCTLTSMSSLAVTPWHLGGHAAALDSMQATARGRLKALGPDHADAKDSAKDVAAMRSALEPPPTTDPP